MSATHNHDTAGVDVDEPGLTTFDLVREGARRDGVEIVRYEPKFSTPGSRREKRIVRSIVAPVPPQWPRGDRLRRGLHRVARRL